MPQGFHFPQRSEMWSPLVPGGNLHDNRRAHLLTVLVDRKRGQLMGGVQGELTAFAESVEKRNPGVDDPSLTITAVALQKSLVAPVRPCARHSSFAVGLLLLIACSNVANLLLARTSARRKEIAVRLALGASPARLAILLLTESVFVSLLAGVVGLFFSEAGLTFIRTQSTEDLPRFTEINLDWHVFAFAFSVSLLSGLFFWSGTRPGGREAQFERASQREQLGNRPWPACGFRTARSPSCNIAWPRFCSSAPACWVTVFFAFCA